VWGCARGAVPGKRGSEDLLLDWLLGYTEGGVDRKGPTVSNDDILGWLVSCALWSVLYLAHHRHALEDDAEDDAVPFLEDEDEDFDDSDREKGEDDDEDKGDDEKMEE